MKWTEPALIVIKKINRFTYIPNVFVTENRVMKLIILIPVRLHVQTWTVLARKFVLHLALTKSINVKLEMIAFFKKVVRIDLVLKFQILMIVQNIDVSILKENAWNVKKKNGNIIILNPTFYFFCSIACVFIFFRLSKWDEWKLWNKSTRLFLEFNIWYLSRS